MSSDETKPFQSARLIYRAVEPEDEPFNHELESDPGSFINSQLGLKRPQAKRDSKKRFDDITQNCLLGVVICLPAEHQDDKPGTSIGMLDFTALSPEEKHHRNTELGLGLLPAHQGKGYGTEAIEWALQWAFEHAGLHRVAVKAFEYNPGARKLYERLGFKLDGVIRQMFWHNGRWWDDYEYGMLEDEWRARRSKQERPTSEL